MTTAETVSPESTLRVSPAAAARAHELIQAAGDPALKLRVAVDGGGCSGFRYDVRLDAVQAADDVVLDRDGVRVLVDRTSLPLLAGAEIDFVERLADARFVIHNPNAKTTCGCGSSFTA